MLFYEVILSALLHVYIDVKRRFVAFNLIFFAAAFVGLTKDDRRWNLKRFIRFYKAIQGAHLTLAFLILGAPNALSATPSVNSIASVNSITDATATAAIASGSWYTSWWHTPWTHLLCFLALVTTVAWLLCILQNQRRLIKALNKMLNEKMVAHNSEPTSDDDSALTDSAFTESAKISNTSAQGIDVVSKPLGSAQSETIHKGQSLATRSSNYMQNRILIVDDNPINQQVLINQLTLSKYPYKIANNGEEALRLVETDGPFDLILLDVMMPQMSGYEVCIRLREKYPMEELSIIFLTAKSSHDEIENGFKVGASDFLSKPFSKGELNSRIKTQLQLLNNSRNLEFLVDIRTQEVAVANNELQALDEIVGIINQEIRIDPLLAVILKQTIALFPSTNYVAYWKLDERTECFTLRYTDIHDRTYSSSEPIARCELEPIFLNEEHLIAHDIYLQSHFLVTEEDKILMGLPQTASNLSMAFRQNGVITGILILGSRDSDTAFHSMLTSNYERLRNHIDSALSKARLVEKLEQQCEELEMMSFTDPLTGLKNRRFLTKYIEHDVSLLQRKHFKRLQLQEGASGSDDDDFIFFIIDIDHFKHTNDSFGHAAGDRVLAEMKQIFEPIFRTSDYRIRWGGEEFLIIARFCDREHAAMKAEQVRSAMENFPFVLDDGKVLRKTCSIGYACYPFSKTEPKAFSWAQVISLADLALYAVKHSQRNGWMGITHCESPIDESPIDESPIDESHFATIMTDPAFALERGHILVTSNLSKLEWAPSRSTNG